MDKKLNIGAMLTAYLREFATIFSLAIITVTLVGKPLADLAPELQEVSSIFSHGAFSLPYNTILQLACFALIMAAVNNLLFSEMSFVKLRILWRYIIFSIVTLITVSVFAFVFKWFPVNNLFTWIAFILTFLVCFSSAIGLSFLILKLDDKKYNKLLEHFKANRTTANQEQ